MSIWVVSSSSLLFLPVAFYLIVTYLRLSISRCVYVFEWILVLISLNVAFKSTHNNKYWRYICIQSWGYWATSCCHIVFSSVAQCFPEHFTSFPLFCLSSELDSFTSLSCWFQEDGVFTRQYLIWTLLGNLLGICHMVDQMLLET